MIVGEKPHVLEEFGINFAVNVSWIEEFVFKLGHAKPPGSVGVLAEHDS